MPTRTWDADADVDVDVDGDVDAGTLWFLLAYFMAL